MLSMTLNIILTINSMSLNDFALVKNVSLQKAHIKSKAVISLNNFNYSYLINTKINYCGKGNGKDLLFIAFVPVSPKSFEKRDLIRSTCANDTY